MEPAKSSRLRTLATVIGVIAALYLAQAVLIPFALAALSSFFLAPLTRRLERAIGRTAAVVVVVTAACGGLGSIAWLVTGQVTELAEMIPRYRDNITSKLGSLRPGALEKASVAMKEIEEGLQTQTANRQEQEKQTETRSAWPPASSRADDHTKQDPTKVVVVAPSPGALESIGNTINPLLGPLGTGGMVIVLVVFMLLAGSDLRDRIVRLAGRGNTTMTTQAMDEVASRVSRYLLMQTLINGIHGLAVAIGMFVLDVPNFLLWGLLSAVLRFVPYVGPIIAAAMPILVSLAVFDDWSRPLMVIGYFVVLELLSNNLLEPWLYGNSAGVSPLAIIVTSIFWAWLWGPLGLLLATPLTVCMVVIGKHVAQFHFINILLGDEPVLEPHMRFYQRLVAMDHDEAVELAERAVAERGSLLDVYDGLVMPALGLAELESQAGQVDERRNEFIHRALHELIEDLPEAVARNAARAKDAAPSPAPPVSLPPAFLVLVLPANDDADALVGNMLAQCIRWAGGSCESVTMAERSLGIVDIVQKHAPDVVCISALAPSALTHARHVYKRIAVRFPEQRILIGLWNARTPIDEARRRITTAPITPVTTTLKDTLVALDEMARTPAVSNGTPVSSHQSR